MLSLKDAERFIGFIRFQGGSVPEIPYLIRRDALFHLAKRGSDVRIKGKNFTPLKKIDKRVNI